jgi:hypothetical protein
MICQYGSEEWKFGRGWWLRVSLPSSEVFLLLLQLFLYESLEKQGFVMVMF